MFGKHTKEMEKVRPEHFVHEDVPLIGFDTMKALFETNQNAEFVCVLTEEHFKQNLIERSHWIPLDRLEEEFEKRIPDKDKLIVVYCASFECPQSTKAAKLLKRMGYKHVLDYKGGIEEWHKHNMPLQTLTKEEAECYRC